MVLVFCPLDLDLGLGLRGPDLVLGLDNLNVLFLILSKMFRIFMLIMTMDVDVTI